MKSIISYFVFPFHVILEQEYNKETHNKRNILRFH